MPAFIFIGRRHDQHIRNATHKAKIETAGMRRAVGPNQSGSIQGEQYIQILQGDIMDQLIVSALQKSRINRHDRLRALASLAGR